MATGTQRMANGAMFFVPPYGTNVIQAGQIIPGTVIQANGIIQYAGQPPCPPQQNPQVGVLEKMLKVEAKTLGAIQIMIGLMHIGFGVIPLVVFNYVPLAGIGGYPFWGGLFFIISGSLSVSVENHLSKSLVKCSVGMNITSAVMALIGAILYFSEIGINVGSVNTNPAGLGVCILLFFFSLLEFSITVPTAHFGCRIACCNNDTAMVFVAYTVGRGVAGAEGHLAPPAYEDLHEPTASFSGPGC